MKRTRLSNFLRQRRLLRKLARQSARRRGKSAWMYRDHVCTVTFDAASGRFVGTVAGMEAGPFLHSENVDELRTALQLAIDARLDGDASNENDAENPEVT
jgi:hypothetical protein